MLVRPPAPRTFEGVSNSDSIALSSLTATASRSALVVRTVWYFCLVR